MTEVLAAVAEHDHNKSVIRESTVEGNLACIQPWSEYDYMAWVTRVGAGQNCTSWVKMDGINIVKARQVP